MIRSAAVPGELADAAISLSGLLPADGYPRTIAGTKKKVAAMKLAYIVPIIGLMNSPLG